MIRTIAAALVGLIVLTGCSSSDPTPREADQGVADELVKMLANRKLAEMMPKKAQAHTSTMHNAIELFCMNTGRYPSEEEGLAALLLRPAEVEGWLGPYIENWKTVPKDPWGNAYRYVLRTSSDPDETEVISLGADGEPGGTGANADIVNGQIVGE
jgi:general secretion pathway protein G